MHSHGGVARLNAELARVAIHAHSVDFDALERGCVFRLERLRQRTHARAHRLLHFDGGLDRLPQFLREGVQSPTR